MPLVGLIAFTYSEYGQYDCAQRTENRRSEKFKSTKVVEFFSKFIDDTVVSYPASSTSTKMAVLYCFFFSKDEIVSVARRIRRVV